MKKKKFIKILFFGILSCVVFLLYFLISSSISGDIPPQEEKDFSMKKMKIVEEDIDYFASTVIDFLGDWEDFSGALDSLTPSQTEELYRKIEEDLANRMKSCKLVFKNEEKKDEWIVSQVHEIRKEVVENSMAYLRKE